MSKYNGWENYATWNIVLWIDNVEDLYRKKIEKFARLNRKVKPSDVRSFVRVYLGGTTPDLKGSREPGCRIKDVNWQEIADAWQEEIDGEE
jgi:hypothetical protein